MTRLLIALALAGCGERTIGPGPNDLGGGPGPDLTQPPGDAGAGGDLSGGGTDYTAVWGGNANDVWIVGTGGAVLHGHDGAFAQVPNLPAIDYFGVSGGLSNVLLVGAQGTMLRSADGGATFAAVASGTTADLRCVSMVFGREAYAVGDAGTMVVSHDGGATFAPVALPVAVDLHGVRVFSDGDAYEVFAVGGGGTILHGFAGIWTVATKGGDLNAVWAAGPQSAFAGADNRSIEGPLDTVLRLDSSGVWQTDLGYAGTIVYGLDASNSDDVWAAGAQFDAGGLYFHRTAAGWAASALTPHTFRGAWVYAGEVYLVGDASTILHNPPL
jgi:photosystem II stability/assembly factor-like uncharacterized protein